jgi:hypothetical protein
MEPFRYDSSAVFLRCADSHCRTYTILGVAEWSPAAQCSGPSETALRISIKDDLPKETGMLTIFETITGVTHG